MAGPIKPSGLNFQITSGAGKAAPPKASGSNNVAASGGTDRVDISRGLDLGKAEAPKKFAFLDGLGPNEAADLLHGSTAFGLQTGSFLA